MFLAHDGLRAPRGPVVLNRRSPLAHRVLRAHLFAGGNLGDLAGGAALQRTGTPTLKAGLLGQTYDFTNNSTDKLAVPRTPFVPEFSVVIWARRNSGGTASLTLCGHSSGSPTPSDWLIYISNTATGAMVVDIPWVATAINFTGTLTDATSFHAIGYVRTGATGAWNHRTYIDGALDNTVTGATDNPDTGLHPFRVGEYDATTDSWNGEILAVTQFRGDIGDGGFRYLYNPQTRWNLYREAGLPRTAFVAGDPCDFTINGPLADADNFGTFGSQV